MNSSSKSPCTDDTYVGEAWVFTRCPGVLILIRHPVNMEVRAFIADFICLRLRLYDLRSTAIICTASQFQGCANYGCAAQFQGCALRTLNCCSHWPWDIIIIHQAGQGLFSIRCPMRDTASGTPTKLHLKTPRPDFNNFDSDLDIDADIAEIMAV